MKIFSTSTVRQLDRFTIEHEPISSIDLMERASMALYHWIQQHMKKSPLVVLCGTGNNGGDGLALARIAGGNGWEVSVYVMKSNQYSDDFSVNIERLKSHTQIGLKYISDEGDFPAISPEAIVVDGLFGSGLNRPIDGLMAQLIKHINELNLNVISIDIPSGLMGEDNTHNPCECIIKASVTLSFQFPKLAFLLPENEIYVGQWHVLDIGLHPAIIKDTSTVYHLVTHDFVRNLLPVRRKFSHKGTYGHALLIAGSYGKIGAAVLASKACLKSGVGLLNTFVPKCGYNIIQTSVPEAMACIDKSEFIWSQAPDISKFDVIAVGPGIGVGLKTRKALTKLLRKNNNKPMVIDADALNILSVRKKLFQRLPENTILTPHPKEFERLAGSWKSDYERLMLLRGFSQKYKIIVVLKGAYTTIALPNGDCYFNSTGNPGMATAGAGDVLTGIILALLAQGLKATDAAILGVYCHGLAGDIYANSNSEESLTASDIVNNLGQAFADIRKVRFYHK